MADGTMGSALRLTLLANGHLGITIGVAHTTALRQDLEPYARRRIAAIDIIQMVAVTAKDIAHRMASILHRRTARNKQ